MVTPSSSLLVQLPDPLNVGGNLPVDFIRILKSKGAGDGVSELAHEFDGGEEGSPIALERCAGKCLGVAFPSAMVEVLVEPAAISDNPSGCR